MGPTLPASASQTEMIRRLDAEWVRQRTRVRDDAARLVVLTRVTGADVKVREQQLSDGSVTVTLVTCTRLIEGDLNEEMDHLNTPFATKTRPERFLGEKCGSSVSRGNPWYIRAIAAPPARLERATYGLEVRSATTP